VLHVQILLHITGFKYRFPCFGISIVKLKSFTSRQSLLLTNGCESRRKGINALMTRTPLFRTTELLDYYEDEYDGVIVDPESLPSSANAFAAILQASISYWRLKVVYVYTFYVWSANFYFSDNTKRCTNCLLHVNKGKERNMAEDTRRASWPCSNCTKGK